jgi:hypothetical protein
MASPPPSSWVLLAPDGTIEAFSEGLDADVTPFSIDETYTCDASTGAQELQFSFISNDTNPADVWRLDVTLVSL